MFQNAAIDVAIGLILMYLMLSLLCTVANEFIATKLSLRSSTLKDALHKLIDDPDVLQNFYAHGLIASSSRASATGSQTTREAIASGSASAVSAVKKAYWQSRFTNSPGPGVVRTRRRGPAANAAPAPATNAAVAAASVKDHPSYLAGGTVALALMGSLLKDERRRRRHRLCNRQGHHRQTAGLEAQGRLAGERVEGKRGYRRAPEGHCDLVRQLDGPVERRLQAQDEMDLRC